MRPERSGKWRNGVELWWRKEIEIGGIVYKSADQHGTGHKAEGSMPCSTWNYKGQGFTKWMTENL